MEKTKLICGDCLEEIRKLERGSVHCVITSPPYNVDLGNNKFKKVGYNTHNDNMPYEEYLSWMKNIFTECYNVLSHDGRMCINIGDGKNGKVSTHSDFIQICKGIGFIPLTTIVWNKNNMSNRCAWGSYLSAKAPSFPTPFEYILVFGKTNTLERTGITTITKEEWLSCANGLWTFAPEKKQKAIGHPAMFPIELPHRLMRILTYQNDVILDPFMGTGTTGLACLNNNRNFIGIEIDELYYNIAKERINNYVKK